MIPDAGPSRTRGPVLYADFNGMLDDDLVLLSTGDTIQDFYGNVVELREGMEILVYMDDPDIDGRPDNLVATGVVERNRTIWSPNVRWCCRIDAHGIRHQSEL